ncbi:hypothetical protein LEP1GSC150_3020 [Leptospira interrogans serovar Copenhageni str. LT2050]|uniref:Uncharacterized protein n=1 Tax=Leptospira interrogans serovar Copenhageni str. LT2050 TaxID=1001598 RepID=M3GCT4_LEPIT|nr:hypothetical protein LEP1GSC150_3020 [Leptospira interrogans serovar Copenhageni str. LT2050]
MSVYYFIFFDCLPDSQSSENNLFLSLLSLPKNQGIILRNDKSIAKSKTTRKYGWVTFTSQVTGKKSKQILNDLTDG